MSTPTTPPFEVCASFSYGGEPPKIVVLATTKDKREADRMVRFVKTYVRSKP